MEIPGPTVDLEGIAPPSVTSDTGQVSNSEGNMGVGAYVVRAMVPWGRIVKYLNLGGKERDKHPIWSPASGFYSISGKY